MENTKKILLSFDIEEFDLPEEYNQKISDLEKNKISLKGLNKIINLLEELKIKATFFTTANFALGNKKIIRQISKKHEIACHGFSHKKGSLRDVKKAKQVLEKITNQKISGFRTPRAKKLNSKSLAEIGFSYDSSINPFYLPGRYNNMFKKRTFHHSDSIILIPSTSTIPIIRYPIHFLTFKSFPTAITKTASKIILKKDKYLTMYFHSWEFSNLNKFKIPKYIKSISGDKMLTKLKDYLVWLKKQSTEFKTFSEFILFSNHT